MRSIIFICGLYSAGFGIFHMFFWRLLKWNDELKKISTLNRAVMQILNLRIIYFALFVAFLCFLFPAQLSGTVFGQTFMGGISLFWLGRAIEQFLFIKIRNGYMTVLTILFVIGAVLFALPIVLH